MHDGYWIYRSTMRGSCFMEYYVPIKLIYEVCVCVKETCRWNTQEQTCGCKRGRLQNKTTHKYWHYIHSAEQTNCIIFDTLLPRKQLCMYAVRFILSVRLALVHLSMCIAYWQNTEKRKHNNKRLKQNFLFV